MTLILCPLANDAIVDDSRHRYRGLGPNARTRHNAAIQWQVSKAPTAPVLWAFGAGTDMAYRGGPTLAALAESYVRLQMPAAEVMTNRHQHNYYGTYEEMKWVVDHIGAKYLPGTARFVFFGPSWHLMRARLVWLLFFQSQWGRAKFVSTDDGAVFELRHEVKAWVRIVLIRTGLLKGRDQSPYPPIPRNGHSEC